MKSVNFASLVIENPIPQRSKECKIDYITRCDYAITAKWKAFLQGKAMSVITTSNNIEQAKPSDSDMLSAIRHLQSLAANMRKLRYQANEFASPDGPAISRTKSYEMILVHPQKLDQFLASFEMSNSQLSFLGLSPATDAEWLEWIGELAAEEQNRREQSNPTDKR